MNAYRLNAVIVGVLFIIGTGTGIAAAAIGTPIVRTPDYLTQMAANENKILVEAFLQFIMAVACAGIGLGLYPIMKNYSVGLAIGAAGFRLTEGITEIMSGVATIGLLALSQEFVKAGAPTAAYFQTIGAIINAGNEWLSNGVSLIVWCIGAFMYYGLFYQHRIVPRWISIWGLIGITLTVISSVLVMLGLIPGFGTIQMIANLPIMPQEIVFAIWLIAKGVDMSAPVPQKSDILKLRSAA